jgi:hypothetical protein
MASCSAKVAIGRKVPINYQKTSYFLGVSSHLNVYPLMSKLACSEQDFYLVLIILIKWDFTLHMARIGIGRLFENGKQRLVSGGVCPNYH